MEDICLFACTYRTSHGIDIPPACKFVKSHQSSIIKNVRKYFFTVSILDTHPEFIDLPIHSMELFVTDHTFKLTFQKSFALKPVHLGSAVFPDDISFFILERPWHNYYNISFHNPYPLLDLSRNTSESQDTVHAPDPYLVCTQQGFNGGKHFICA